MFWHDNKTYLHTRWINQNTLVEPILHFESKLSWNPTNQQAKSRNYRTEFLQHTMSGEKLTKSETIAEIEGWILEGTVYQMNDKLITIRGRSDSLGELANREIVIIHTKMKADPVILSVESKVFILAAIPSPDMSQLVVFTTTATMDNRNEALEVRFFSIENYKTPTLLGIQNIKWSGVPGVPMVAWHKTDLAVFLYRSQDVLKIEARSNSRANQFPQCFIPTDFAGDYMSDGQELLREQMIEEGQDVQLEMHPGTEGQVIFQAVPYINDVKKIGQGCSG